MHQPTAIDAILIFDTAKDQRNNLVHSQRQAFQIFYGTETRESMLAIVTSAKSPYVEEDEDPEVVMRERAERATECGMPHVFWESKKITPEELREQTIRLIRKVKQDVKPFKLVSLEDKWSQVTKIAEELRHKPENMVKETIIERYETELVLRDVELRRETGTKLRDDVKFLDLLKGSRASFSSRVLNNKYSRFQEIGLGTLATIYSCGLLPIMLMVNETTHVAELPQYREPVYEYYTEKMLVEESRPIYKDVINPAPYEKMEPIARRMVKD